MSGDTSKKNEAKEGGLTMNFRCPILNSTNYTIWALKIRAIFNVHGIWEAVEPTAGTEVDQKKNNTAIAMLYQALPENMILQIANLTSAKERSTMNVNDSLDIYAGKISEIASQTSSLGHTLDDKRLVRKLLGSVPEKYIQIVTAIEQFADLNTMPFQEAVGRLKAFEERTKKQSKEEDMSSKLLFTKEDGKEKEKEHKCERCGHESSSKEYKGRGQGENWKTWRNKYGNRLQQNKDHIRCFKCNKLGHFKHECPNSKKKEEANLIWDVDDEPTLL
ncbi:zinc finger, CCHC-type [Artemisia annua]|uniref:Zinc finger, CCHC-type n=1 Tax=Artemisia annua TaxID=35608 RepID=A0A2U1LCG3_ARTAN|nr:zinc finger, CCHC-type [Artemisia annua]